MTLDPVTSPETEATVPEPMEEPASVDSGYVSVGSAMGESAVAASGVALATTVQAFGQQVKSVLSLYPGVIKVDSRNGA